MQLIILLQFVYQKVIKFISKMLPSLETWLRAKWSQAEKWLSSSLTKTTPKKPSSRPSTRKRKSKRGRGYKKT
jgi:hypothetical protein